jgi:hypothetical protein
VSIIKLDTEEKIVKELNHIDKTKWIKPLSRLIEEVIHKKELLLFKDSVSGKVYTDGVLVSCRVFSNNKELLETSQVFKNGKTTNRNIPVSGKVKLGTSIDEGILLELSEELSLDINFLRLELKSGKIKFRKKERIKDKPSTFFTGTYTNYDQYIYEWEMPIQLYKEQYIEHQPDKDSYFTWVKKK